MKVDVMPNKLYRYDGRNWIHIDKKITDSYLNDEYIIHLTNQVINKHIEIEDLTIQEQQEVENEIRKRRSSNQS